jgi:outer membrane protein assembly factor BamD (BamD/ComL family)
VRDLTSIIILLFLAVSCQTEDKVTPEIINELEAEIRSSADIDTSIARELIADYRHYRELHSGDSLSPYYLLKEADLMQGVFNEDLRAIGLYNQLSDHYPSHPLMPRALFMKAYVYDEKLSDRDNAINSYETLIRTYPNHPLSSDARNLLSILTDSASEEEQVAKWLEKAKSENNIKNKE